MIANGITKNQEVPGSGINMVSWISMVLFSSSS